MKQFRCLLVAVVVAAIAMVPLAAPAADQDPVLVGSDQQGDSPLDSSTASAGVDAEALFIHRPDFAKSEIQFIVKLYELNAPPPNEVVRYLWRFTIGGREFLLQAKTSDVVTTVLVDDPAGAVQRLAGSFRLRGDCVTMVARSCRHLRWVDGDFDVEADEVRMRVPLGDPVAPEIVSGATIEPLSAEAGFQVVLSQAGTTTDEIIQDEVYLIPG